MIAIAKVLKSVGVHGEIKLKPLTHDLDRFKKLQTVWVGIDQESVASHSVQFVRMVQDYPHVRVEGISDPETANTFRGQYVFVDDSETVQPQSGSFFIHDIIGLNVVTTDGEVIGTIREVLDFPANDVWVVDRQSKELLLPAIKEIVREVDLKQKRVVIQPMKGLLDDAD